MIVIGALLTFSLFASIWTDSSIDLIFDILAMLGSGILCSAIVALLTEIRNDKILVASNQRNRTFVLSLITDDIKSLLVLELKHLSAYALLSNTGKTKTKKCDLTIQEIITKINCTLSEINTSLETIYQFGPFIDTAYLKKVPERNRLAYQNIFPYYEHLQHGILKVLNDANHYLINGILDEDIIAILNTMQHELASIISSSNESNLELLFDFKEMFFENLTGYLNALGVAKDELLQCYIKETLTNLNEATN